MKVKAHEVKHALSKKHAGDFFLTEVKSGSTWFSKELAILDALAIKKSWTKPCITGYEVKVSRQDFLNDSKWPVYKNYCHRFYFACPKGLIQPDELPDDVGLIWLNPETGSLYTRKKSKFRDIEMPADMFYYIILSRLENSEHPFFTSKKEYFEEYVADKINSGQLGFRVSSKLIEKVAAMETENARLQRMVEQYQHDADLLDKIRKIMRDKGFRTWRIEEELQEVLTAAIPPSLVNELEKIKAASERLLVMTKKIK